MEDQGWVAVVDDDSSVRRALSRLLRSNGIQVEGFASIEDYLHRGSAEQPTCIVLDVNLGHGPNGFDLLDCLASVGVCPPVILITGQDEIGSVRLEQLGAAGAYLTKPFDPKSLLERVQAHLHHGLGILPG